MDGCMASGIKGLSVDHKTISKPDCCALLSDGLGQMDLDVQDGDNADRQIW